MNICYLHWRYDMKLITGEWYQIDCPNGNIYFIEAGASTNGIIKHRILLTSAGANHGTYFCVGDNSWKYTITKMSMEEKVQYLLEV